MKHETYKNKNEAECKSALLELRRGQLNLRFRKKQGNLEKPSEIKKTRRAVARVKTQIHALKNKKG